MAATEHPRDEPADQDRQQVRIVPWPPSKTGDPPESRIGDRLRYSRNELSLSIEALARLTKAYDLSGKKGVSPSSLLRYETGDSLPGARELRLLCDALEVPSQWLLMGQIPTGGTSAAQQLLLSALAAFMRETLGDHQRDAARGAELREIRQELVRSAMLNDARKPPAG